MNDVTGMKEASMEGKEGKGLAVLAGDSVASAALGVLFERVTAAIGAASFGQGGQGPAVVELEAGDAARLLMLARAGAAASKLEQLSSSVARLLGACGAIKPGRGRPVSVATALQDLRAVFWSVSGRANEVARRDAVAAGLVAVAAGSVPADAAEQLGAA